MWQLKENYGLEEVVLRDLASENNLLLDWEGYEKVSKEKVLKFKYSVLTYILTFSDTDHNIFIK